MSTNGFSHVYGPVPSRRLGRSLGIDLVPFKVCTYDCVYCQLGRTTQKTMERREYVPVEAIVPELERALSHGAPPDYIGLAGSGEPTLNSGIGRLIRAIKKVTRVPVAVLTNGSLLWMKSVQDELMAADLVVPSLDAGDENTFRRVNRPHGDIAFGTMTEGLVNFTERFDGDVWLEVLLLAGETGTDAHVKKIAALAEQIGPDRIQLGTVIRPPAETDAGSLSSERLVALKGLFSGLVELIGKGAAEGSMTAVLSGTRTESVLAMLGRRPCTAADVAGGLNIHINEALKHLDRLMVGGKARPTVVGGRHFYTVAER
ncbi:MAG: radical SAM protein [Desulfobacterales bacterium]|nr:radical SAM protein [Desulfobacterales bacterium]